MVASLKVSRYLATFLLFHYLPFAIHKVACDKPNNTIHAEGRCIWYGECAKTAENKYLNCYNNTKSILVPDHGELYKALQEVCPWYVSKKPNSTYTCCNLEQMNTLQTSLKLAQQQLGRCPSCYKNFRDVFCATTCDPSNSLFMDVNQLYTDNKTSINIIDVYFTNYYTDKFFNSCKDIENAQDSSKVIDLMCGSYKPCTGQLWLKFMGTPQPTSPAPFTLKFNFTTNLPTNMSARNATLLGCDDTLNGVTCSCADCPAACPAAPTVPPEEGTVKISFIPIGIFVGVIGFVIYNIVFVIVVMVSISLTSITRYTRLPSDRISQKSCFLNDAGRKFEGWISQLFAIWGEMAADCWFAVIPLVLVLIACCCIGLLYFEVTTDPVELWSAPSSQARKEKNYFDHHFGPFYRTSQIIITAPHVPGFTYGDPVNYQMQYEASGMFQQYVLDEILLIQNHIASLNATYDDGSGTDKIVTLQDICFQPLSPDNKNCTIYSILNYFQNSRELLYREVKTVFTVDSNSTYHIQYCTKDPTSVNDTVFGAPCLAKYGGPVDPNVALGGFGTVNGTDQYMMAKAVVISFIINNHVNDEDNKPAIAWEEAFIRYMKSYKELVPNSNLTFSYSSESSISEELDRESLADVRTIAISYFLMFFYIALFLGSFARRLILAFYGLFAATDEKTERTKFSTAILVNSRIGLGFVGVLLVAVSVVAALGLLSFMNVKGTLIIIEVVPFLVLAVGTDNLFILTHAYERQRNCKPGAPVSKLIGEALGEVAPSILLTSLTETMAFLLGGISTMPAVRTFSFFAGTAVFINFLLQITVFVAVLSLDSRRIANNCADLIYCIKFRKDEESEEVQESLLFLFMNNCYAPFLMHKFVRVIVLYLFSILFFGMSIGLFNQDIGLSQSIALPKDSYLQDYFDDLNEYLHTGPPVYFVIKDGYDYTNTQNQEKICSSAGCNNDSVGVQLSSASVIPEYSKIAEPASNWLDSYYAWIDPRSDCCVVHNRSDLNTTMCSNHSDPSCEPCLNETGASVYHPNGSVFMRFLPWFLESNPDATTCTQGGHAAFGTAVQLKQNDNDTIIKATYLMSYHTILKDSKDYIDALRRAREYSDSFSQYLSHDVFAYSVFYVFYEQYLTIKVDVVISLSISLSSVFVMSFLLMGFDVISALIVTGTVALIIVDMLGMMAFVGISLNAISLVNLVMAIGISVEFCSHIVRWFAHSPACSRVERAKDAVAHMGTSVLSGITFTKLLGVLVLVFAKSQIFVKFYFGMYMLMIGFGALHGLVFLPVLLSYIGPFAMSYEDQISYHSSSNGSAPGDPVNYESIDSRMMTNSPAIRQAPYNRSPYTISVELGGPSENTKLLEDS